VSWPAAALEWQSRAVVARHLRVYLRNWHTAFLPPAVEPVTMLVAFGIGLGGYVATLPWQGRPVEYLTYVAPGLLAYATFMTAIFQSLFAAFIRMRYQRTWEGQLTTQVELAHVIWGEVLWAALLATMYVVIVAVVLTGFHAAGLVTLRIAWLPAVLPVSFVAACAFGALGLCFTALMPTIDHMNLPVFLLVLPMGLLSSTYFPLEHPVLVAVNLANPLYHLAQAFRGLLIGGPVLGPLAGVAVLSALLLVGLVPLDLRLLRRRVLGET
jgi:lipooligosaccharide transport system permease protein